MQMRTGTCTYLIEGQLVCRTPANMFLYICCIFTSIALVFHKPSTWDYLLRFILVAIRMALKVRLAALVLLYERNMGSRNLCLVNYYCRIPSARHSRHLFFFLLFFALLLTVPLSPYSYFIFRSLQRSHSNSLPRNMSLGPQAGQPGHSEVPAESFQDVSLQSLQWLESRGLYGGKANDDNLDTGKVQLPVSSGGSGRGHRSRGHLSEEVYTMQMNSNTDRWAM